MVREVRVPFCPKLHRTCNKSISFFILCTKSNLEKMHVWKTECRSGPLALVLNEILQNWPELESLAGFISLHFLRDHLRVKTTQKKKRKEKIWEKTAPHLPGVDHVKKCKVFLTARPTPPQKTHVLTIWWVAMSDKI